MIVLIENTKMPEKESITVQNEKAEVSGDLVGQVPHELTSEGQPRDKNRTKVYLRGFRLVTLTSTYVIRRKLAQTG